MTLDRKQIGELKISTSHNKFIKFAWLAIADIFQMNNQNSNKANIFCHCPFLC